MSFPNFDIGAVCARIGNKVALQGNLDPTVMLTSPEIVAEQARQMLYSYGVGSGHIFNLGHGVTPGVPPEYVAVLVDTVHEYSRRHHAQGRPLPGRTVTAGASPPGFSRLPLRSRSAQA